MFLLDIVDTGNSPKILGILHNSTHECGKNFYVLIWDSKYDKLICVVTTEKY